MSAAASTTEPPGSGLDRSLATGLAWTAAAKWSAQVLSWVSTFFVARLLVPEDYGIIAMAAVYIGIVQLISEFGLGTAVVQREDLDETQISHINGLSLAIGIALFVVSLGAAPILARFFNERGVSAVVVVLATTFVITSLQVVPNALLARAHQFRRLAIIESAEALTTTVVALSLAIAGAGYWALVLGNVAGKLMNTVLILFARGHRMSWPRHFSMIRDLVTFGWQVVVARLAWYGFTNADFVVIARVLGKTPLGAYSFGWQIASLPADKISGTLGRVVVPVFASAQRDRALLQRYVVRMCEALVVVVLPASIGMAIVSYDFVRFMLGEQWLAAALPLTLLSIHVTVRCVNALFSQALFAIGDARQNMRMGLWLLAVMPVLFYIGAKLWGVPGVAVMWLIGHPAITFPALIVYTSKRLELPLRRLADTVGPPLLATCVMALAVVGVREIVSEQMAGGLRLALMVSTGAIVYPALMWIVYRERMRSLIGTFRYLRKPDAGDAAALPQGSVSR